MDVRTQLHWLAAIAGTLTLPALHAASPVTQIMPLTGTGEAGEQPVFWDFRLDSGRGSGRTWNRIVVPSCWEQQGFGGYYYGTHARGKPDGDPMIPQERGEYRVRFTVPPEWRGQQIRIVFEGVMTDATVRINERSAGPTHQGGFYRFEYDVTGIVQTGASNYLDVSVSKESANPSVNRAERRGDYWTFGGIYRPVWLEARPPQHIDRTAIDARADGEFRAEVHLGGAPVSGGTVQAQITDSSGAPVGSPFTAALDASGKKAVITGRIDSPRTWSAETPNLYRVSLKLLQVVAGKADATTLHESEETFGFRTFEVRPRDGVYLNGRKIVLKGINHHSFDPETGRTIARDQSYADVRLMKEANMNAVRMSHYPPDPHLLKAADELGMYVLDELAGWQGAYDTPTGSRLIGQMVRRDVNHPSILFWDNGNEGGWNVEVDGEFARWDPQRRPVLHPWAVHSDINTDHYETYDSTKKLSAGPEIFMPTEFLHGLYDGGIGAGFEDYWQVMSSSPTVAGGFFWSFVDEGVRRTDQNGRLDNVGNSAPDGIVGPHREKEGSFFAVKEIWSPVQVRDLRVSGTALEMQISNRYAFTDLSQLRFTWQALKLPQPGGTGNQRVVVASGEGAGPAVAPGANRAWSLPMAAENYDVVQLKAIDPSGSELWTWSVAAASAQSAAVPAVAAKTTPPGKSGRVRIDSAPYILSFDKATGRLLEVRKSNRVYPLQDGPNLIAYRRVERRFEPIATAGQLMSFEVADGRIDGTLATATYDGPLRRVTWSRAGDALAMSYELAYDGPADVLGVGFAVPEEQVTGKRWVGLGPYRVWQNRLRGGVVDLHETAYNDSTPGQTYEYPEFKGYFSAWRWLSLQTRQGEIIVENTGNVPYFGLFKPQGGVSPVLDLPDVGVAFLTVIPAMGTKFTLPDVLGPQSQTRAVSGVQEGRLLFRLGGDPPSM